MSNLFSFIAIKVLFTLISPLSCASVDIVDDEGSFQFFPEAELTSPLYTDITRATEIEAESPYFAQMLQF